MGEYTAAVAWNSPQQQKSVEIKRAKPQAHCPYLHLKVCISLRESSHKPKSTYSGWSGEKHRWMEEGEKRGSQGELKGAEAQGSKGSGLFWADSWKQTHTTQKMLWWSRSCKLILRCYVSVWEDFEALLQKAIQRTFTQLWGISVLLHRTCTLDIKHKSNNKKNTNSTSI